MAKKYNLVTEPSGDKDRNVNEEGTLTASEDKSLRMVLTRDLRSFQRDVGVNEVLLAILKKIRIGRDIRVCKKENMFPFFVN